MSIFDRKPALRWVAPLAFVAVVGATGGVVATADAQDTLPPISAADLLVKMQQSKVQDFSGTVVQNSDLGLPSIPGVGGSDDASLTSLVSGSHTLDVWHAGTDQARLRVQGKLDESDVITNGKDVWTWSYKDKTATHRTLTAPTAAQTSEAQKSAATEAPKTPQEAATKVLAALEPTTVVSTGRNAVIAGQNAYELVLTPKDSGSLVSQVRIAVDSDNFMPLRVQVVAGDKEAFAVYYTKVDFSRPSAEQFTFKAPAGTKVTEAAPHRATPTTGRTTQQKKAQQAKAAKAQQQTKVVGHGWTSVLVTKVPSGAAESSKGQLASVLQALPEQHGTWGSGRVLKGTAFTAVLTDDGRLAVGSVDQKTLLAALDK